MCCVFPEPTVEAVIPDVPEPRKNNFMGKAFSISVVFSVASRTCFSVCIRILIIWYKVYSFFQFRFNSLVN